MSQSSATVSTGARAYRPTPQAGRPRLQVISAQLGTPRRLPFVLLCSALLAAGLIALLLLNTSLAQGAYLMHAKEDRATRLAQDEMMLREQLAPVTSAQSLAASASKLGMVPLGQPPLTLELSSGAVRGLTRDQAPAGEDQFSVTTTAQYTSADSREGASAQRTAKPAEPTSPTPSSGPSAPSPTASSPVAETANPTRPGASAPTNRTDQG